MIGIIDYGAGNIFSIKKAFDRLDIPVRIIRNSADLEGIEKLILPGVGHAGLGMKHLGEMGLVEALNKFVLEDKKPILGICLGLELMTFHSEEGNTNCLGWLPAYTKKFQGEKIRIPHMGWNTLKIIKTIDFLEGVDEKSEFYFAHSYYIVSDNESIVVGKTEYGEIFDTVLIKENIIGVQFHPEKSHEVGLALLRNFSKFKYV